MLGGVEVGDGEVGDKDGQPQLVEHVQPVLQEPMMNV